MLRYRLDPKKPEEAAAEIAAALEKGSVVAPLLDGYCVLSLDPSRLVSGFGRAFKLAAGAEDVSALLPPVWSAVDTVERVTGILRLPVAAVLGGVEPWDGIALAQEGLMQRLFEVTKQQIGVAVPDEDFTAEELVEELGQDAVLLVESGKSPGPGPAVADFRTRPAVVDRRGRLGILGLERELGEIVRLGPDLIFSVLVVCTGNACRSPMAAGILSKMLAGERVFICSAGTGAPNGMQATNYAVAAVGEMGVDLRLHRSQQLDAGIIAGADLILVMEEYHRQRVLQIAPGAESRTRLLGESDIADPIGRSLEFYRKTAQDLKRYLEPIASDIRKRLGEEERS